MILQLSGKSTWENELHAAAAVKYTESHLGGRPALPRKNKDTEFRKRRKFRDWPVAHPEVLDGAVIIWCIA